MKTNQFLIATAAVFMSIGAYAQTVDEIVDKHVAALGGMDKLNNIKTMVTDRSFTIQGMEVPTKTTLVVGKSLRSESTVMGNSMIQVVDGTTGWMIRPAMMGGSGDPEDMPGELLKSQSSQLDPFGPLVNYKEKGNKVELVGKEKVDKKDNFHLKVTTKEGQTMDEFVDANTYLVSKVKMSVNGQDNEIGYSDYKEVEGVKFPNTLEVTSQMGNLVMTTNKTVINGPVDNALFKKPSK
ncbi:LolA family protein [Spirosoma sp. KUDC1026]|uniref:LolA family protein n=1 Tax=Spirosoma sp. KUDC1026 TaxID=2745947 RepID=UPI00159BA609|nr:outer membrane lipoprotein-sorting protein [Spirosoma sp. KUDC1026]QKZ13440.1 outer membrane lipoprotein-sorting protein [Spirosoma sp. KUDC1026]